MRITTPAFNEGNAIPRQYTCDGENAPPPLNLTGAPANAKSLALLLEDPDAPGGTFTHWLVWTLPPQSRGIVGTEGTNDFARHGYSGPCPPPGPAHRYVLRLLALDTSLALPPAARRVEFDAATRGHVLAEATFMGKYGR
ncbi:MAG: Phospholipid-binding protein [Acidobacteria bacterium]|nr:Phospholipid-binding protein [Acidobacteriota bacterium]